MCKSASESLGFNEVLDSAGCRFLLKILNHTASTLLGEGDNLSDSYCLKAENKVWYAGELGTRLFLSLVCSADLAKSA